MKLEALDILGDLLSRFGRKFYGDELYKMKKIHTLSKQF